MPPTPVDDHTEEFEQLAALSALDVLEGDERLRFEQHAAHCERCQVTVRLDREALARAAPEMDPSPDFKARLLQRAAAELASADAQTQATVAAAPPAQEQPPDATLQSDATLPPEQARPPREPTPLRAEAPPPNVIPLWRRAPRWASALAAVFVLGVVVLGGYSYQNQVVASYPLTGSLAGSAVVNVRRNGAAELNLRGMESPPPGHLYEAWIIPPGGAPVSAGVSPTGDATLPLSDLPGGATVAITREPGRVDAPTDLPPPMAVTVSL
jgi:anti-sigma-K factor RskA